MTLSSVAFWVTSDLGGCKILVIPRNGQGIVSVALSFTLKYDSYPLWLCLCLGGPFRHTTTGKESSMKEETHLLGMWSVFRSY